MFPTTYRLHFTNRAEPLECHADSLEAALAEGNARAPNPELGPLVKLEAVDPYGQPVEVWPTPPAALEELELEDPAPSGAVLTPDECATVLEQLAAFTHPGANPEIPGESVFIGEELLEKLRAGAGELYQGQL